MYHLLTLIRCVHTISLYITSSPCFFLTPIQHGKSARHKKFTKKFSPFSKKITKRVVRGFLRNTSSAPSKLNTQAIRYVPCNTSRSRRCAKTFRKEASEKHLYDGNPGSYRQAITIAARTMILLYGAAGEPSRGEIPMILNADRSLIASHSVWGLRTNNTHD